MRVCVKEVKGSGLFISARRSRACVGAEGVTAGGRLAAC